MTEPAAVARPSVEDGPDYTRKWYVMSAVAMGIFLATIDGSIVNVALPTLSEALGADFAAVQWVVLSYLLTVTTLLAIVGRLADMYGRRLLYTSGFIVFTVGSLLCGLAPTAGWLILLRVVQGVGAALILALGLAIVTDAFPPGERGRALGVAGAIVSIGIVSGPVLGGLIIESLSWHWIFFVNVPIGILGTVLAYRHVRVTHPPGGQRFDLAGAAALCLFLLSLLLALTIGQREGFAGRQALLLFGAAAVLLVALVFVELRTSQPILEPALFRERLFTVNLVTAFFVFVGLGTGVLIPFYLSDVLGYSVQQTGLLLAALPIALGVTSPISGALSDRVGSRSITMAGLFVILIGFLGLATLTENTSAIGFMVRYAPLGVGIGLFQSPNTSAIMGTVPRDRLGIASGLLAVTRTLGQTIGIALLGALWAAMVFRASGEIVSGGATAAAPSAQVAGLQAVMLFTALLTATALIISVWAWSQERKAGQAHASGGAS